MFLTSVLAFPFCQQHFENESRKTFLGSEFYCSVFPVRLAARAAHPAILQLNKGDDEKMATRLQVLRAEVVAEVAEVPSILQPGTVSY